MNKLFAASALAVKPQIGWTACGRKNAHIRLTLVTICDKIDLNCLG